MQSKKLVWCCIIGIILGLVVPRFLPVNQQTALMVGMVGGLGIGYLLDMLDEKKSKETGQQLISEKADQAARLMEQARAELNGHPLSADEDEEEDSTELSDEIPELTDSDEAAKLSEAEALLRQARERMK